jgi:hypothetical protein
MAAHKENKYAEKWTEKKALEFIKDVHEYIKFELKNYHLGLACVHCGQYPEIWAYLGNKFKDNSKVFKAIKKIEIILEARIINSTMTGDLKSAAMAIFYLKNKHGYKDKSEQDINIDTGLNITVDNKQQADNINEMLDSIE